jgi:hypothetical protein
MAPLKGLAGKRKRSIYEVRHLEACGHQQRKCPPPRPPWCPPFNPLFMLYPAAAPPSGWKLQSHHLAVWSVCLQRRARQVPCDAGHTNTPHATASNSGPTPSQPSHFAREKDNRGDCEGRSRSSTCWLRRNILRARGVCKIWEKISNKQTR